MLPERGKARQPKSTALRSGINAPVVKIDAFTHFLPRAYAERLLRLPETPASKDIRTRIGAIPALVDLDVKRRQLEEFGADYRQITSLPAPPLEDVGDAATAIELAKVANEGQAELVDAYPDTFIGWVAQLPLNDVEASVAELERAVGELGAAGVQIYTNVAGRPWDEPEFEPILAKTAELDCTVWVHPSRNSAFADYQTETRSKYEIWWTFGWPYETSAFMARIVFSGIFDRYPDLRFFTHHGGALVPHFAGRVGPGWDQLGARTPAEDTHLVETSIRGRPLDYFKKFYADTCMMDAPHAIRCCIEFFGVDHVLFASDSPFDPEKGPYYIRTTIANIEQLDLSDADRNAIYTENARRIFKLD
jgi:predicted TIM-barrel fold metal-dependent hydrolase